MLVLDANILIRAVLGSRVFAQMRKYAGRVGFKVPDTAGQEARQHLPEIPNPGASVWNPPLVIDVLPALAQELQQLLTKQNEPELAAQVPGLRIVGRCHCGDDFCATFYVQPKPQRAYGPDHRNVVLDPKEGVLILDVDSEKIACIEALYRDDVRKKIQSL